MDHGEQMRGQKLRRRPAHGVHLLTGQPTIIFLTVCTKNKDRWLACEQAHSFLLQAWRKADAWQVGRYVLMPDHLHLFCAPANIGITLDNWVRFWKNRFQYDTHKTGWHWQSNHWDTRLRRSQSYDQAWEYVRQNPERAGLVTDRSQWPYQGTIHELRW